MKSVKPKNSSSGDNPGHGSSEPPAEGGGRSAKVNSHRQKRSNDAHASTTDPDARLYRKGQGKEAKLCFMRTRADENRYSLLVDARTSSTNCVR